MGVVMYIYWTREGEFKSDLWDLIPFRELHRLDGPAIIGPYNYKAWCKDGKKHREDGPAVTDMDDIYWFLNDVFLHLDEYIEKNDKIDKVLFKLIWG